VQTNWKPSPEWTLNNADKVENLKHVFEKHYAKEYGSIFGGTKVQTILKQTELDVLGLSLSGKPTIYAIDVAFHSGGLGYTKNSSPNNTAKVIQKILRMTMCVCGCFSMTKGEIIFASPKINPAVWKDLEPCEGDINALFKNNGLGFTVKIIANERFQREIIAPVQDVAKNVKDTSELFLRSYQLLKTCKKMP
jgi:hypothetical protein